jgi:hypothetical protein
MDARMAQILLTHPIHGSKFALSESEVENDAQFGWARYTADTPAAVAPVKRKYTRRTPAATLEQPNSTPLASDESEGP